MVNPIEIFTQRLLLRPWRSSDLEPFAQLNADPEVMSYFPDTLSREQSDDLAQRCQQLIQQRGWGFWAVEHKRSDTFIGFLGLHVPSADLPFSPCVEIGWRLAKTHWGSGYATEGGRAALQVAFDQLNLDEVVSFTAVANRRSRRVMERLGMGDSAENFEHPAIPPGHHLRQHCLYRITNAAWQAAQI
ncbi:MAG: GNAT family N-acetyltransferase [Candidatus Thiodiazotropha taylori]|nr:GNAT family N-acetyltransferase [Candidatus Thiodiazotropha taylori]MCG8056774.1 GNAT family N-acetyltransferase [Candidatus Thiodiazotropha taylori]MCG8080040.1 GNAT family N-acetyltransferase [Candidatus Thiodiazotropha taylori]MCG8105783.1 GNAT family N-acetyltransferase [Candidatus Thiodiazotropha taylori]MCG8112037.1 GNAT family N-acetyltransferase [Candidatus Thiodiazotropha taylori]